MEPRRSRKNARKLLLLIAVAPSCLHPFAAWILRLLLVLPKHPRHRDHLVLRARLLPFRLAPRLFGGTRWYGFS